jgi:hypothetical protein
VAHFFSFSLPLSQRWLSTRTRSLAKRRRALARRTCPGSAFAESLQLTLSGCDAGRSADAFAKKEWYDVKAPSIFVKRDLCKTVVNKTQGQSKCCWARFARCSSAGRVRCCAVACRCCLFDGASVYRLDSTLNCCVFGAFTTEIARDGLINRVFEASLGDLKEDAQEDAFRKFSFRYAALQQHAA